MYAHTCTHTNTHTYTHTYTYAHTHAHTHTQAFKNIYHYGCWNNWIVFCGLGNGRSFLRHVLLPSSHKPYHNGMDWEWDSILNYKDKLRTYPV